MAEEGTDPSSAAEATPAVSPTPVASPAPPASEPSVACAGHGAPPPQPWLNTLAADLASLLVFTGAGTFLGLMTPLAGPRKVLAPLAALVGLWGVGVERGKVRPPSPATCALLSLWAAGAHLGFETALGASFDTWSLARAALIAIVGGFLPALATRFDRGETAWREAVRCGPPTGSVPTAAAVAAWRPPGPLAWLSLLLLPLDWALRAASVLAILGYQLTLSRLMPSACHYEPSCSRYGFKAYLRHSFLKASFLTALRVLRCSPLGSGGYDPIPDPSPLLPGARRGPAPEDPPA